MEERIRFLWRQIDSLDVKDLCFRTGAKLDEEKLAREKIQIILPSFSGTLRIDPEAQHVEASYPKSVSAQDFNTPLFDPDNEEHLLLMLSYLLHAKNVQFTSNFVKPESMPGGQIYVQGTHMIPLDALTKQFGSNKEVFLSVGEKMGGHQVDFGDIGIQLLPFPRISLLLILWIEDDEFPARTSLLFDYSCRSQAPPDILWGIANCTVNAFLDLAEKYYI